MNYLLTKGGVVIYPLLATSVIALTIIIERAYQFIKASGYLSDQVMQDIKNKIAAGKIQEAVALCETNDQPIAKIIKQGILYRGKEPEQIKKQMEEVKLEEFPKLEQHLGILNFLGKIAPSLGLLGTVVGIIKTFHVLSLNGQPQQLAGGISEALLTTAMGLTISIPTLGAYYYFMNRLHKMVSHAEKREVELINHLDEAGDNDGV
ncbi:MotA/TolQ/ExbB proton channel family protein [Halanaerobacter jeridensis]|uniref:Biopolymer transport protein ExbB n=1 Tax=Halanaerobacter jeridensis TaxID=706427 RepID=A0A939BR95_9FIRM|nr:MotA/TolQ/ExbB proton channel family protein [Halanaerobacter jeridensis]MBM7557139.1 biopolymer transport protein ExbB [Halanaerobacter jeridensis]